MPLIEHSQHLIDRAAMVAMRGLMKLSGGPQIAPAGRAGYDALMERTPGIETVFWSPDECGGIPGWWGRPDDAVPGRGLLYLHGGCYVLGSATAYRGFAGHIAARARATTFVPDYRLAPEHPFPMAFDDACSAFDGLEAAGMGSIALVGDSAGGGLGLALLASGMPQAQAVAAALFSPWIDLSLSSETIESRASVDPILSRLALQQGVDQYLRNANPLDPRVNALSGDLSLLPRVRIDVGDDEILLADSIAFGAALDVAKGNCEVHIWKGMPHVFPINVTTLKAASEALDAVGAFLEDSFANAATP